MYICIHMASCFILTHPFCCILAASPAYKCGRSAALLEAMLLLLLISVVT
jgi:hypothetical protein